MGCCVSRGIEDCTLENSEEFSLKGKKLKAKVLEVYDGDTITIGFELGKIFYRKRCRIYGIDCAELRTKSEQERNVAINTKIYVEKLLLDKVVSVEVQPRDDKYGRVLAKILLGDLSIGDHLIEKGLAYKYEGDRKKNFKEWYNK